MAGYSFAAERQLIFHVMTGGCTKLVQFGERSLYGASTFYTTDAGVAAAIRRHSMFRRGAIKETTVAVEGGHPAGRPEADAIPELSSPTRLSGAVAGRAGTRTDATRRVPTGTVAGVETREGYSEAMARTAERRVAADVIEVDNFTEAKEIVSKRLCIDKKEIKTPLKLDKVAKEHGLVIKYREK